MKALTSLLLLILLSACSPSQDQTPKIADDQRKVLEEAKSLDANMQQSAEEQARQAEDQTR
ncbi:MAG TPA: hypothetical protein VN063_00120 [Methylophilaceae bacterium]|nr:hypothetical protein [Methylophilaceae bacterium]